MPSSFRPVVKFLLVSILGYLLIAALQILVLEIGLKGEVAPDSPTNILGLATIGTVLSGLIGGFVSARLAGTGSWVYVSGILAALVLDAIYVLAKNADGHPVWYNVGGALTLIAATAFGVWIQSRRASRVSTA